MAIQNYDLKPVGVFISSDTYHIPDYQREFSWETSQIEDFWSDLKNLRESNESEHFFGQIVIHTEPDSENTKKVNKYVIDGQQRTTTSIIMFCVLKDICLEIANEDVLEAGELAEDIRRSYLGRWLPKNDRLKFRPSKIDAEYFFRLIQFRTEPIDQIVPSNKAQQRMRSAYVYLYDQLKLEINDLSPGDQFVIINEFFEVFNNNFKVMYVETTLLEEAFIIFESLNARGKGLETSDLLKNHLFKASKNQIEKVKSKWEKIIGIVGSQDATKFVRYYWNSYEEFSRTQNLFRNMKNKINTEGQVLKIVENLESLADVYITLNQKNGSSVFADKKLNNSINNLKEFNASSFYPIVFSMFLRDWNEKDMSKVISEIEKLIFRNIIIAKNTANKYEILFANIAHSIFNKKVGAIDIVIEIQRNKISDEVFRTHFSNLEIKNKAIVRYILNQLNTSISSGETVISDSSDVHIEHILPQTVGKWKIYNHEEYVHKLGNLTLLGSEFNRKISNHIFEKKKPMYKKSEIKITQDLLNYHLWGPEQIEDRQKNFTNLALTIW